jgi:hypothetical protein
MKRWWLVVAGLAGIGMVIAVVLLAAPKPPIPSLIKQQAVSTILVPRGGGTAVERESVVFDAQRKQLSYNATFTGTKLRVSEQATPESFTDIPQTFDKLTAAMGEYGKFDTDVGTVHLTRPKELGGKQAAVLNAKGTLLFAKPAAELSDDQWRQFFRTFEAAK